MEVSDDELKRRLDEWRSKKPKLKGAEGYLQRYRFFVTSADKGAVLKEPNRDPALGK
jgi:dihydroxyacid dehydratase/phosphogluconate dehydratase